MAKRKKTYIYVGPRHRDDQIVTTREGQRVKPRLMDDEQRKAFVARYPQYESWWVIEEEAAKTDED